MLATGADQEARSLGPMVKRALAKTWQPTAVPQLLSLRVDPHGNIHHLDLDLGLLEAQILERDHGRENTSHQVTVELK